MKRLDQMFSVFNSHINDASNKADAEFIAQFGQKRFDEKIKPFHEVGLMTIFDKSPCLEVMAYVCLITAYVNEGRLAA